jgi:hypothetical protein
MLKNNGRPSQQRFLNTGNGQIKEETPLGAIPTLYSDVFCSLRDDEKIYEKSC